MNAVNISTASIAPAPANESLKDQLQVLARGLGFDLCRVASCLPPAHASEFRAWLGEGRAGEMAYMERGGEKRCDPQQVLPGARSIIVLALNYWQGEHGRDASPRRPLNDLQTAATGKIARYAWGDDYHDVIETKLKAVDEFLRGFGGVQKCYVDTGPVLERDHAAVAGIGWHGKSTMLINTELGTWFFLAEVLTTLELPPDAPIRDRCGTCSRCLQACPTGAITEAHRVDARRCISYLTIEHKTSIPLELRPLIGDRIFGCDDCLDACPWNRFATASRETAFQARSSTTGVALRDYLALTEDQFRQMFRGSPIKRIKRRGFLRNVCVALGNVGDASDIPLLERTATDSEPLVAEHALWAIEQIRRKEPNPKHLATDKLQQPMSKALKPSF
jgi:epoxyqueuosine reductase